MSNLIKKLIELAETYEKDFDLRVEQTPPDEAEYVFEIMYALAWKLREERNENKGAATIQQTAIQKLQREYKQSDDTVKTLRTALADHNDMHQKQINRLIEMLKLIVETPVTHGQKNGMILLVAEIAQRFAYHDLYLGDIPF